MCLLLPSIKHTVVCFGMFETAGMQRQPEHSKFVELFPLHELLQVGGQVSRLH